MLYHIHIYVDEVKPFFVSGVCLSADSVGRRGSIKTVCNIIKCLNCWDVKSSSKSKSNEKELHIKKIQVF